MASVIILSCHDNSQHNVASDAKKDSTPIMIQSVSATAVGTSDSMMLMKTTAESWKLAGFTNPDNFKQFFTRFKQWVANGSKDSIAAHIKFPLRNCPSKEDFLIKFDTLFNTTVKKSVAEQDPDKFFANYNGAMTGNGEVWFNEKDGNYFVITINN